LYRLRPAEVGDLGLDELMDGSAIVAIEWPDRLLQQPPGAIRVAIADAGADDRRISISSPDTAAPVRYSDR
jgi:tRNA A37 threonylcarbamoyladenosine biosynthesis protein TsaE